MEEEEACKFFQQLIAGIEYLHRIGCAHRDVKPSNILVDRNGDLKLIDFGLGNLYSENEKLQTACGSPCYAAPEIISGEDYNPLMVDIWSSGVTLFAMLSGYLPFDEETKSSLYKKILQCDFRLPDHISAGAIDLMNRILVRNPRKRLGLEGLRKHPWVQQFWMDIEGEKGIVLNSTVCRIAASTMKVSEEVMNQMVLEREHNKYTTT